MHPLDTFHFCPRCGSSHFEICRENSKICKDCHFEYFKNPAIGVAVVVLDAQNRILCVQRENEPKKGLLSFPGGFCSLHETIEETAVREVKEETNIDITLERFLLNYPNTYVWQDVDYAPLDFYFLARVKDASNIKAQEGETSHIRFVAQEDIDIEAFAFDSAKYLLRKLLPIHL